MKAKRLIGHIAFLVIALFGLQINKTAQAATLYFFPESAVKSASSDFTVTVFVNSTDKSMNAVSGAVTVPTDKLDVVSISKANTIISLWVQEPTFVPEEGRIKFEGIVLNPGFTGATGRVITITFRPKTSGTASVRFVSGSVLANDGEGTNILNALGTGSYVLQPDEKAGFPAPKETKDPNAQAKALAGAPSIKSDTHPEENRWYNHKTAKFSWDIPEGVDGVSYILDQSPNFKMVPQGRGLIGEVSYNISHLSDGPAFFQLQFHTAAGWGPVGKRMLKNDFTPPSTPSLSRKDTDDVTNPTPTFSWTSSDTSSGLAKYQLKIGNGEWMDIALEQANGFTLPTQTPGERHMIVRAHDLAGNWTDTGTVFTIEALSTPKIEDYSRQFVSPNDKFFARGSALPGVKVELTLKRAGEVIVLSTDSANDGKWSLENKKRMTPGIWDFSVKIIDGRGAMSNSSENIPVEVISPWVRIAKILAKVVLTLGIIFFVIGLIGVVVYYMFGRAALERWKMRKELSELRGKVKTGLAEIEKELSTLKTKSASVGLDDPKAKEASERMHTQIVRIVEDIRKQAERLEK